MKPRLHYNNLLECGFVLVCIVLAAGASFAQSSSFTYQGRLTDGGTAASGNYDLQFALFKEQQTQIQQQRELIERQRTWAVRQQEDLNALKKLVCRTHRPVSICR